MKIHEADGYTYFVAHLFVNGVSNKDVPPIILFHSRSTNAEVTRGVSLVVAMLRYLNMAGTRAKMVILCDAVCSKLGDFKSPSLELCHVMPGSPPNVVWKEPGGGYLRVVEDGFSETLDEQKMAEFLQTSRRTNVEQGCSEVEAG